MSGRTSPPRAPKGSKDGGRFLPKWAGEIGTRVEKLEKDCEYNFKLLAGQMLGLSERLGTSTPLIIWNIAVLVVLAGLGVAVAKLYGLVPY
jgi:hypothetical protein